MNAAKGYHAPRSAGHFGYPHSLQKNHINNNDDEEAALIAAATAAAGDSGSGVTRGIVVAVVVVVVVVGVSVRFFFNRGAAEGRCRYLYGYCCC